ncbi:hypothetical protein D3C76_1189070 [compost metagenome]
MEPEGGAAIRLAVEGDIPAHLFHQFLGDHQPKAGPAVAPGNTGICLAECLEQTGLIAFGNTNSGIADLNLNLHFVITDRPSFYQHINVAAFGKFDRIAHQIGDHLLQAQRIADHIIWHIIFNVQRQLKTFIVR